MFLIGAAPYLTVSLFLFNKLLDRSFFGHERACLRIDFWN
jgi:hypothetical protein